MNCHKEFQSEAAFDDPIRAVCTPHPPTGRMKGGAEQKGLGSQQQPLTGPLGGQLLLVSCSAAGGQGTWESDQAEFERVGRERAGEKERRSSLGLVMALLC